MAIKPGSAGLAALVLICSICALVWPETTEVLRLAPGNTFAGQHALWNLVTCAFVETNLLMLAATVLALLHLGSIVETRMHTEPWLIVAAVGVLTSSVVQAFLDVYLFLQTRDEARLFSGVGGSAGLLMTVAVATVQAIGEGSLPGAPMVKPSFLPGMALVAAAAMNVLGLSSDWAFAVVSLLAVWAFLRYFQARHSGGRGDARPEFAFERLWPARARPLAAGIARLCAATVGRLPCFQLDATTMGPAATGAGGEADDNMDGFAGRRAVAPRAGADGGLEAGSMASSLSGASLAALAGGAARLLGSAGADGSTGGTSAAASAAAGVDPVAERRRARAMAALDKRLQDIEKRRKARVQRGTPTAATRSSARTGGGDQ